VTVPSTDPPLEAVRTVIIDDHDVVHAGIEAWCANADPPIVFVGSFVDPQQFLQRYPEPNRDIDVVLFDLQIDGSRPDFDTLRRLCESGRRVIIYSH
jgi:DNA-binding NarL/FixJ family response regulator